MGAQAGKTLDKIKQRGVLQCGVSLGLAGFSASNSQGVWRGLDVDICKALAAAVLGDASKVKWVPLNAQQRFAALQSGEVDVLSRNTSWTLSRDASLGFHFTSIVFYDGQGFMVSRASGIRSARQLKDAEVCVQSGTTTEKNMSDYFRALKIKVKPIVFENFEASLKAFFSGRCQAYTTDASSLAAILQRESRHPEQYLILPELISKEPMAPVVRNDDNEWFAIVKWVVNALITAEEEAVTQANVAQQKTSDNPVVQRLLGVQEDTGRLLGLDRAWAYRAISAVGNYGEIFERNLGSASPLKLARGPNKLWSQGGLIYAPPIR
ncbi:MAG: amino acid ABC transporter substrate-binding protein [Pseudomonadota bacterium]